ncbi:MAG: cytochrome bd-I oxidase subunit CydX [Zoogloeaceae bacterium]|nr:cytochrome bd-I oxidase subunit CydX [Rhodocyclaceae bacterium]MCP5236774.1 cytochrome bd-I oxidase subunit CydX [Zoogloeaceae bacterium]
MWYFAWILGIGFAVLLAILNAMWGELESDRLRAADTGHGDRDELRQ